MAQGTVASRIDNYIAHIRAQCDELYPLVKRDHRQIIREDGLRLLMGLDIALTPRYRRHGLAASSIEGRAAVTAEVSPS